MEFDRCQRILALCLVGVVSVSNALRAQDGVEPSASGANPGQHDHSAQSQNISTWQFMHDGVLFAEFNHQGGPRGGNEIVAPNWWMGMVSRDTTHGRLTLTGMFSLDPVTVGKEGYREILQAGEALDGRPLIDRQHPHDVFMQLAAVWRVALNQSTGITLAGAPIGEPTLGPVAFMHRSSAADNPTAPLSHHTFDSTHIAFGVVAAALDFKRFVIEGSLFNGREPDENRWDLDFGRLDSFAGRVWFKPNDQWEFQGSSGRLERPEELEEGNVVRSTVSASWTRTAGAALTSVTAGYGRNATDHGGRNAVFIEGSRQAGQNTFYGRLEALQVETLVLQTGEVSGDDSADVKDPVFAFTVGAGRDLLAWRGFAGGIGADLSFYGVPGSLQPFYSSHPVSFHLYFRLRPRAAATGRMGNMRMLQPMAGHAVASVPKHHHQ